jgi:hypothetical protein
MRQSLLCVVCCCSISAADAGEPLLPDGSPLRDNGGIIIMRRGDQTTVSLGGVLFPRRLKVTTATPEGPVVTRFTLPATVHSSTSPDWLGAVEAARPDAPALLRVEIPDADGMLYVEGAVVRWQGGAPLESPPLPQGQPRAVRLRAVFAAGDKVLVEDKQVVLRAGESASVTFDGSGAIAAVPLPTDKSPARPK